MARIGLALGGGLAPGEIVDCVKLAEELATSPPGCWRDTAGISSPF